jgi:hypothetical protein
MTQGRQSPGKSDQLSFLVQLPVEPTDLVILAISVVVAAVRATDLVSSQQHGGSLGQQQRRHYIAYLPLAQNDDFRSSLGPSAPQFQE